MANKDREGPGGIGHAPTASSCKASIAGPVASEDTYHAAMTRFLVVTSVGATLLTGCAQTDGTASREPLSPGREATATCATDEWPGPWTACPEAVWVREIVTRAGCRLTGETGSALIAACDDTAISIWVTRGPSKDVEPDGTPWTRHARIANTVVYGDARLWRFWRAQGYVFWVKPGPRETDRPPSSAVLAELIEASQQLQPPSAGSIR
jgi:hypothetical protein